MTKRIIELTEGESLELEYCLTLLIDNFRKKGNNYELERLREIRKKIVNRKHEKKEVVLGYPEKTL